MSTRHTPNGTIMNNNNVNSDQQPIVRPTEAQLRWAQFHRKGRVRKVKDQVERMWQYPLSVKDVQGAFNEDGDTSAESGSSVASGGSASKRRLRQRVKPKISRGRRALLRVSKRAYEKRHVMIKETGYRLRGDDEETVVENFILQDDDPLHEILAMEPTQTSTRKLSKLPSARRKRRKTRGRSVGTFSPQDKQRVLRFEAAYGAVMASLQKPEQPEMVMADPGKIWKRPENLIDPNELPGGQYDDLRWGFRKQESSTRVVISPSKPTDRRASWLVHLPSQRAAPSFRSIHRGSPRMSMLSIDTSRPGIPPGPPISPMTPGAPSPRKAKFDELVYKMQNYSTYSLSSQQGGHYNNYQDGEASYPNTESPYSKKRQRLPPSRTSLFSPPEVNKAKEKFDKRREMFQKNFLEKQSTESSNDFKRRRSVFQKGFMEKQVNESSDSFKRRQEMFQNGLADQKPNESKEDFVRRQEQFTRALFEKQENESNEDFIRRRDIFQKIFEKQQPDESKDEFRKRIDLFQKSFQDDPPSEAKEDFLRRREMFQRSKKTPRLSHNKRDRFFQVVNDSKADSASQIASAVQETPRKRLDFLFQDEHKEDKQRPGLKKRNRSQIFINRQQLFAEKKEPPEPKKEVKSTLHTAGEAVGDLLNVFSSQKASNKEEPNALTSLKNLFSGKHEQTTEKAMADIQVGAVQAGEAFRKLFFGNSGAVTEDNTYEEDLKAIKSFRQLAAGKESKPPDKAMASSAYEELIKGKGMSEKEEKAFRSMLSNDTLSAEDQNWVESSYEKVVRGKKLTGNEETAFRKLLSGEEFSANEEIDALKAYRKVSNKEGTISASFLESIAKSRSLTSGEEAVAAAEDLEEEEDLFLALRQQAAGEKLNTSEQSQAATAYKRLISSKHLSTEEQSAFQKLLSGFEVSTQEESRALSAYEKVILGKKLTEKEGRAFRKVAFGKEVNINEEIHALQAFRKVIPRNEIKKIQSRFEHEGLKSKENIANRLSDDEAMFESLRNMRTGKFCSSFEKAQASLAFEIIVAEKGLSREETNSFRKLVSAEDLTPLEKELALVAEQKTVGANNLAKKEKAAFEKFISEGELVGKDKRNAFSAYQKLSGKFQGRSQQARYKPTSEDDVTTSFRIDGEEDDLFSALRDLADGTELSGVKMAQASLAIESIVADGGLTAKEDSAYRKLLSGEDMSEVEGEYAVSAHSKVISGKELTDEEENAYRVAMSGGDLSDSGEKLAVSAYRKITGKFLAKARHAQASGRAVLSVGDGYADDEDDMFSALRDLADGTELSGVKMAQASLAIESIVADGGLTAKEDSAYRKLLSGEDMSEVEGEYAVSAHSKVISGKELTDEEENAYRVAMSGGDLSDSGEKLAVSAYRKITGKFLAKARHAQASGRAVLSVGDGYADDEDDMFSALRDLADGTELSGVKMAQASLAIESIVADGGLTAKEDSAYRKLLSGEDMSEVEGEYAVSAHSKVISGKELTDEEENAYRVAMSGGDLSDSGEKLAVSAYRKITGKFLAKARHAQASGRAVLSVGDGYADDEDDMFSALRDLADGTELSGVKMAQASLAIESIVADGGLTAKEDSAYRKLLSGEDMSEVEGEYAVSAHSKVISGKELTDEEENAYRVAMSGGDLSDSGEKLAVSAYRKITGKFLAKARHAQASGRAVLSVGDGYADDEDDMFSALRDLADGTELSGVKMAQASLAIESIVADGGLTAKEDSAYRKILSGNEVSLDEGEMVVSAHNKVVARKNLTDEEDHAFRKVISGGKLTVVDELNAAAAYKKVTGKFLAKAVHAQRTNGIKLSTSEANIAHNEDDSFTALRDLCAGQELSRVELAKASLATENILANNDLTAEEDLAYRKLLIGEHLVSNDEDKAVIAHQKVVAGKGLTNAEEKAYNKAISGKEISAEEELQAACAFRKVSGKFLTKALHTDSFGSKTQETRDVADDSDEDMFASLRETARGKEVPRVERAKASLVVESIIADTNLTSLEDAAYRKLLLGEDISGHEEDQAVAAHHKVVSLKGLTDKEDNAYRKAISGGDLTWEEEIQAASGYKKVTGKFIAKAHHSQSSYRSNSRNTGYDTEDDKDDVFTSFRKMACGKELSEGESTKAYLAIGSIVAETDLTPEQDAAYRKLISGSDLTVDEGHLAVSAHRKVVDGKGLTDEEEVAYRKIISDGDLSSHEERHALSAFQKLSEKFLSKALHTQASLQRTQIDDDENLFKSLRVLVTSGETMHGLQKARSSVAVQSIIAEKNLTPEEDIAYRKLLSGEDLTVHEQDQALAANNKVISGKGLSHLEEDAYLKAISGEDLAEKEEKEALSAYRKISGKFLSKALHSQNAAKSISVNDDAVKSEKLFSSFCDLITGKELEGVEAAQAALAYESMIADKKLTKSEEKAHRKFVSGEELNLEEEDQVTSAQDKIIFSSGLTADEEAAYRKVMVGEKVAEQDQILARSGYQKMAEKFLAKALHTEAVASRGLEDDEMFDADDLFSSLRELSDGTATARIEQARAALAYQYMVADKDLSEGEDTAYWKLVSGKEVTVAESDEAVVAYHKVIADKGLTDDEEEAYLKAVSGEVLAEKEEVKALSGYRKISGKFLSKALHSQNAAKSISVNDDAVKSEKLFSSFCDLITGKELEGVEAAQAALAYESMIADKKLTKSEEKAHRKFVSGEELNLEEEDQVTSAQDKIIFSSGLTADEEAAYRKVMVGEKVAEQDQILARSGYQKMAEKFLAKALHTEAVASRGLEDDEMFDADDLFSSLRELSDGTATARIEQARAALAYQYMVADKDLSEGEDTAYWKLVSGKEVTVAESDEAVVAYHKVIADKGLTDDEEEAYLKAVSGEVLAEKEEVKALSGYRKISGKFVAKALHETANAYGSAYGATLDGGLFQALQSIASGKTLKGVEKAQAALAYKSITSDMGLTNEEDTAYWKVLSGDEVTSGDQKQATTAKKKVLSTSLLTESEKASLQKAISGEKLVGEEERTALSGFRKASSKFLSKALHSQDMLKMLTDEDEMFDAEELFSSFRELASGKDVCLLEKARAALVYKSMVVDKGLSDKEELSYRKLVSGENLNRDEEGPAVAAYGKVLNGSGLTNEENAAYQNAMSGGELAREEEALALSAFKKVVSFQETADVFEFEEMSALQKTASGMQITADERDRASTAYRKLFSSTKMTQSEETAYQKLVAGGRLTDAEQKIAADVHHKLVVDRGLTSCEEEAFQKATSGIELEPGESVEAVSAYKKIVSNSDDECFQDVNALRKMVAGAHMAHSELARAALAYQRVQHGKGISSTEESCYGKFLSGEALTVEECDEAQVAHKKLVTGWGLTHEEEDAYRKLVWGEELTTEDKTNALSAYGKVTHKATAFDNDAQEVSSLKKLLSGEVMANNELAQAGTAYRKLVVGKNITLSEEESYRKALSGDTLLPEEECAAIIANSKVVSDACLTNPERAAFDKLVSAEELSETEALDVLTAYKKVVHGKEKKIGESSSAAPGVHKKIGHEDPFVTSRVYSRQSDIEFEEVAALRNLSTRKVLSNNDENLASTAFQKMIYGKHLTYEEEVAYERLVAGEELTADDEDHAIVAYGKIVSGIALEKEEEAAYGKLISGEDMTPDEEIMATEAYRKLTSTQEAPDVTQAVSSLRKLAAGLEMTEEEEVQAASAYQTMVSDKRMSNEEESALQKLVSGVEFTSEEELEAISAYQKLVAGKMLTNEEENAFGRLISGEDVTEEEGSHAVAAYEKLLKDDKIGNNDVQAISVLRKLASGEDMSESEEIQAATAYQRIISGKQVTEEEDMAYRKTFSGGDLTEDEENQAAVAHHKIVTNRGLTDEEDSVFGKLVSGEEIEVDEEGYLLSAYKKLIDVDKPAVDIEALAAYRSYADPSNGSVAGSEFHALAEFRKMQEERKEDGELESTSSFRPLPDGIRRIVQGLASPANDNIIEEEEETEFSQGQVPRPLDPSPGRAFSSAGRSAVEQFSPEDQAKLFHQKVMEASPLIGEGETGQTIIDTDGTTSDASGAQNMDPSVALSLMMSPTILTKRLKQAMRATERRNWEQISYLVNANPWLAEMTDVSTSQYLLHKLSFFGAGMADIDPLTGEVKSVEAPASPDQLNTDMIRMFPPSVHKFDQEGNLPLHMAAASGNLSMIQLLGERFPSGASVRNNDGFLPLHLAILSCASPLAACNENICYPAEAVKHTLRFFPGGVGVCDYEGNLPLHAAANSLQGQAGADVVYMLLDEADRQISGESGFRFTESRPKQDDDDSATVKTEVTDSGTVDGETLYSTMVRNNHGHNALVAAILAKAGWEIVEAIVGGRGGKYAALYRNDNRGNALHLLMDTEFTDPASILSILKYVPEAACIRNGEGMLPIEVACMQKLPREVVLALVLVDLPIDLDAPEGVRLREGYGGSWWFLTCESDDFYVDVVDEVISICSYDQVRELCFMKGQHRNGASVVTHATPKCQLELRKALRFAGRFEFVGNSTLHADASLELKVYEALDFGTEEISLEEGKKVLLYCYGNEKSFDKDTATLRAFDLDYTFVEENFEFAAQVENNALGTSARQFCLAVERPNLTLDRVVSGMAKKDKYRQEAEMRNRYLVKVTMVLRLVAKALRHLHSESIIHTDICLQNCGKFEDNWKLMGMLQAQRNGANFDPSIMGESAPPEAVEGASFRRATFRRAAFRDSVIAEPSIDVWAFGKLAYEVFVGKSLIGFDLNQKTRNDDKALLALTTWSNTNLRQVSESLDKAGVPATGAELLSHCLAPNPDNRPSNMDEILEHPFWRDMKQVSKTLTRKRQS